MKQWTCLFKVGFSLAIKSPSIIPRVKMVCSLHATLHLNLWFGFCDRWRAGSELYILSSNFHVGLSLL